MIMTFHKQQDTQVHFQCSVFLVLSLKVEWKSETSWQGHLQLCLWQSCVGIGHRESLVEIGQPHSTQSTQ